MKENLKKNLVGDTVEGLIRSLTEERDNYREQLAAAEDRLLVKDEELARVREDLGIKAREIQSLKLKSIRKHADG